MLVTTKGVVLRHYKYSDNSVIAKVYTADYGLQSFIIRGVRSEKSKNKASYLQPLSLVQLTAQYQEKKNLNSVRSIHLDVLYSSLPFDIAKTSIAFFIAEVLLKSIKEEEKNPKLFDFIYHALQVLDLKDDNYANFHLIFMAQLSKYLGIQPQIPIDTSVAFFFDLNEGLFLTTPPPHRNFTEQYLSVHLIKLFTANVKDNDLKLNQALRKVLLSVLLDYYHLHLSNFDNLKSIGILEEVLS